MIQKIMIELSLREANILCNAISSYNPPKSDEMIAFMIYQRIMRLLEKEDG